MIVELYRLCDKAKRKELEKNKQELEKKKISLAKKLKEKNFSISEIVDFTGIDEAKVIML